MLVSIGEIKHLKERVKQLVGSFHMEHLEHKDQKWINTVSDNVEIECSCGVTLEISNEQLRSIAK